MPNESRELVAIPDGELAVAEEPDPSSWLQAYVLLAGRVHNSFHHVGGRRQRRLDIATLMSKVQQEVAGRVEGHPVQSMLRVIDDRKDFEVGLDRLQGRGC